jgi:hypothetical protein
VTISCRGAFPILYFFLASTAFADKGLITWNEGVELSQESQKAIILHNATEEILILGTEMKAKQETEILEFIPFPSEPQVSLAAGNPFEKIGQLISEKGLLFEYYDDFSKGGNSAGTKVPVEIRLSEKIGLHDVTTIKINDIEQFSQWLEKFFKSKELPLQNEKLQAVYSNARDYLQRGYCYFVFDSVTISPQLKFLEPLKYRFKSQKIYFPLKTSNLIGGTGAVEMIFLLPGSVSDDIWQSTPGIFGQGKDRELRLSSSSKLYPEDVKRIQESDFFVDRSKLHLQVLKYKGKYDFKDDFTYDVNKLVPYAYRFQEGDDSSTFAPSLTADEKRDMKEAYCPQFGSPESIFSPLSRFRLDCGGFIPNEEYEVYAALFRDHELSGIPRGNVILEGKTVQKEYKSKSANTSDYSEIVRNFNANNKVAYLLENAFPGAGKFKIRIRDEKENGLLFEEGKTYMSRAGFNKANSEALIYVEHVSGPRAGVGYYVTLEKKKEGWGISGSRVAVIY